MKKLTGLAALLSVGALALPAFAQGNPSQVSPDGSTRIVTAAWPQDQDDVYRGDRDRDGDRDHDRSWRRRRNRDGQYGYQQGGYGRGYHGVLAPEWQQKFDSYYQRWLNYRATNNRDEMLSMEKRMRDIMVNYRIPADAPFGAVASPGIAGNRGNQGYVRRGDGDADDGYYGNNGGYNNNGGYYGNNRYGYHNVLAPEWQQKFDSYYQRWLNYRATNNRDEVASMERRMQDIMVHYNIPSNVPFDQVASQGAGAYRRY